MKDTPKPGKRYKYAAAFRTEALRLAGQSRSTQTHPSQPRLGVRYHVPAPGHWHVHLSMCLPGRGHQACGGLNVGATMPGELVATALPWVFFVQPPAPELVVHSDRSRTR